MSNGSEKDQRPAKKGAEIYKGTVAHPQSRRRGLKFHAIGCLLLPCGLVTMDLQV